MSTLRLSEKEWLVILDKLHQRYQDRPSVLMIRSTMRRELGFTVRQHREYDPVNDENRVIICLDFFDEEKSTIFRLTYI